MRNTYGQATLAAHKGAAVVNGTNPKTLTASLIYLSSDAIVTNLQHVGDAADVKADYISTPGNAIGGDGATIAAFDNKAFGSITLSAGNANWAK